DMKLEILDAGGNVLRTLTSKKEDSDEAEDDPDGDDPGKKPVLSVEPGVQRLTWDLGYQPSRKLKGVKVEGDPEAAPRVPPGTYTARLTVAGKSQSTPLDVKPDPRLSVSPADIQAQTAFALQVQSEVKRLVALVEQIRSVREQLKVRTG